MSQTEDTARAILTVLRNASEPLPAWQFWNRVANEGGNPNYIQQAAVRLRDRGIPVATHRSGANTTWFLAETGPAAAAYAEQEIKNMFSEAISIARSTAGVHGYGVKTARDKAVTNAIVLGERLGYAPEQVVDMCKPEKAQTQTP